ncbi:MAG: hypothetical protein M0P94_03290 [Candidatus Absconditabacterales bacterium]|nr:hypothetical protein [Candidatus Absconditabacterales bacterium]
MLSDIFFFDYSIGPSIQSIDRGCSPNFSADGNSSSGDINTIIPQTPANIIPNVDSVKYIKKQKNFKKTDKKRQNIS